MLNLDLLANGDNRRVNQEAIDRAMLGLTKSRKEFISSCLEKDPSKRMAASALMKSKVLQEVHLLICILLQCHRFAPLQGSIQGGGRGFPPKRSSFPPKRFCESNSPNALTLSFFFL